jgi:phage FluMu gp28-like protein
LDYQLQWIYDRNKIRVCRKPVRCGLTYAHSWWSIKRRMFPRPNGQQINEIFVSKNLKTAAEYMGYLRKWGTGIEGLWPGLINVNEWTQELARLPGGNIEIVSSDPDGFRGKGGEVTLDEIDFHDQQAALYGSAQSRADWLPDGQISLFSSRSYNPATWFATFSEDLLNNRPQGFGLYHWTLDDCVAAGLAFKQPGEHQKLLDGTDEGKRRCIEAFYAHHKGKCASEEDFRREYYWEASGQSQLVTPKVYDKCVLKGSSLSEDLDDRNWGELFVGVDCGRSRDLTVVWVLQRKYHPVSGVAHYFTVAVKSIRNLPFPEQHKLIQPIITNKYIQKGYIDQGAQGRALADSVVEETGKVIQPFGFSRPNKGEIAERIRAFCQSERLSLPDDPLVRNDIQSVARKVTEKGVLTYEGQTRDSHADRFWALGLALHAAEGNERASALYTDMDALAA